LDRGEARVRRSLGIGHRVDLLLGHRAHQTQRPEHLEVLFEVPRGGLDGFVLRRGELEVESDAEPFAQRRVAPRPAISIAVALDDGMHRPALRHTAADAAPDAVLAPELEAARGPALGPLTASHRTN